MDIVEQYLVGSTFCFARKDKIRAELFASVKCFCFLSQAVNYNTKEFYNIVHNCWRRARECEESSKAYLLRYSTEEWKNQHFLKSLLSHSFQNLFFTENNFKLLCFVKTGSIHRYINIYLVGERFRVNIKGI